MANSKHASARPAALRAALAAAATAAVLGSIGVLWFASQERVGPSVSMPALPTASQATMPHTAASSASAAPATASTPPATTSAAPAVVKPSFDVVRVSPEGSSVMAGRAAPDAEVVVRQGEREIGHTKADAKGDWVLVAPDPLSPGARELTLREHTPQGQNVEGDGAVVLVVPSRPTTQPPHATASASAAATRQTPALALLTGPDAAPRVLQGPDAPAAGPPQLALGTVDYGNAGEVRLSGTAKPDSTVRVYVDGKSAGDATAQPNGSWTLVPPDDLTPGQHVLRLDELTAHGTVGARVALPFARARIEAHTLVPGSIVVQPRQNLWLIARHSYGAGIRYTAIFQANRDQIRDPNLIYPGQVFAIPTSAKPPMPTDSSKSR